MGYLSAVPSLIGLNNVNSSCVFDLSLSKFNTLFACELDVSNISDICANTLKIQINNNNCFSDISFSQSTIKSGNTSSGYSDQRLYKDLLRHVTKDILNTPHAVDVYTNEDSLTQHIKDLDSSLCDTLNSICAQVSSEGFKNKNQYSSLQHEDTKAFYICGHVMLSYILDNSQNDISSYNIIKSKIETAYQNNGNSLPIQFDFGFSSHSYLALRLKYVPEIVGNNSNQISLNEKSYKCLLHLS